MPQYTYISIALDEQQQQSVTRLIEYTTGDSLPSDGMPEPAKVFGYFLNARECFVQWVSEKGICFAMVFRNAFSADRSGFYMVTVRVDAGASLTGRQTLRLLNALRKTLVEERRMTTADIESAIASCDIPEQPAMLESWHVAPTYRRHTDAPAIYRTYVSAHELETCFTFPLQKEYDHYSSVIYVAATTSLRPGVELKHVTTPVQNLYTIVTPEGVESSRPAAAGGDRIVLTWMREGYSPIRETVVAGKPSPYVTYDGARMVVRPAKESRLVFTRRIPLTVRSVKGGPVTGYTITVNGRPANTMQPFIEIADQDIQGGSKVVIAVSSNNFVTETLELGPDELDPSKPISVVLRPLEQGITLRLDFGENRVFELQISLEKNTPEYSQLHSGTFHGFRARRLTVPGSGEIYYVDVRSGVKPTAPTFDNVSSNVSAEQPQGSPATSAGTPARRRPWALIVSLVVLAAVIAVAAWLLLPKHGPGDASGTDTAITAVIDTVGAPAATLPVAEVQDDPASPAVAPADSADAFVSPAPAAAPTAYAYLNANNVWRRDSLDDSGKALYDAMTSGDIDAMVRHPYFSTPGAATNTQAVKVADLVWASYGASTQRSNEKALKSLAGARSIDLHDLYETLARYRSPQPNNTPRPTAQ